MATISTNYFNYSSNLFSSATSSSSSQSILGQYSSIKNGSYKKLLTAYYKKQDAESGKNTNTITEDQKKDLLSVKSAADKLYEAANALKNTDSLFERVTKSVKDEKTGVVTETSDYDWDKIMSSIDDYVKAYNSVIDNAGDSDKLSILRKTAIMVSQTQANKNLLSKVGITIGEGNKLSVDEKKLKEADINDLKTLFTGTASYVDRVGDKGNELSSQASKIISSTKLYGVNGKYSTSNTIGNLIDTSI